MNKIYKYYYKRIKWNINKENKFLSKPIYVFDLPNISKARVIKKIIEKNNLFLIFSK